MDSRLTSDLRPSNNLAIRLLLKPELYLHIIALLFALIVTSCTLDVANGPHDDSKTCAFNDEISLCTFSIVFSLLSLICNLVSTSLIISIEISYMPVHHRIVALAILTIDLLLGLIWLIIASILANRWIRTPNPAYSLIAPARTVITFSFLSFLLYVIMNVVGFFRVLRGPGTLWDCGYYKNLFTTAHTYTRL